jgi:hypothetical protein
MVDVIGTDLVFDTDEILAGFPVTAPVERAKDLALQAPLLVDRLGELAMELGDSDLNIDRGRVPAAVMAQQVVLRTGDQLAGLVKIVAEDEDLLRRAKS